MLRARLMYLGHYYSKFVTVKYENKMRQIATGLTLLSLASDNRVFTALQTE
jgi:hypothetical protein